MTFLIQNWFEILITIILATTLGFTAYAFLKKPADEKIKNVKQWLLGAVIIAERELQGGTGELKLREVYDAAIERFPFLIVIPFSTFSLWVDEALVKMKELLETNPAIARFVRGEE